jgi:DNA-binding transcriptional LysR family regulator
MRLLQCFEALLAERNVSRAASRLDLSQPAMSHALARLRRLFDDPLLLKGRGGMTPTARALELAPEVRTMLAGAERLLRNPGAFDPANARARFSVMTAEYVEYLLAPLVIQRLQREAPAVELEFRAADRERALNWLERGEIDLRLGWWPESAQTLHSKLLFRDALVCLARKGHSRVNGAISAPEYLAARHVRIQTQRTGVSMHVVDRAVALLHRKLHIVVHVQNALALCNAVAGSELIATVPARLARALAERFSLQVLACPLNVPDVRMAMYWHERTHKLAAHRWFRQLLADTAKTV